MYSINATTITLTKGDSFYCTLALSRNGETYEPDPADVILFGLKKSTKDAVTLISKTIPNDTLLLHLDPSDTEGLPIGSYVYDIEVTLANGDVDTVINRAKFNLIPEVI